ncbi:MAG: hypothetical protein Q8Q09_24950 [Deltaproteobacteria bacterium]|nr:hypothetical protein [Deltaproteobacteria bacterium]
MKTSRWIPVALLTTLLHCTRPHASPQAHESAVTLTDVLAPPTDSQPPHEAATANLAEALPTCTLVHRPSAPLGRKAMLTSLTVRSYEAERQTASQAQPTRSHILGVAWIVSPQYLHGGDDMAASTLHAYASAVTDAGPRTFALTPVVTDAEEPSTARGLVRSPVNLYRAYFRVGTSPSGTPTGTDQLSRDDDGNELVEAGDFSASAATVGDTGADNVIASVIARGSVFYARTAYDAARPFVLGLRTDNTAAQPSATMHFFATRAATAPASQRNDFWPMPLDVAAVRRSTNPVSALRGYIPEALELIEVPGSGYAVTFRANEQLYLGWLDLALRPVGPLHTVPSPGSPGKPRISARPGHVLYTVAASDLRAPDAGPSRYRLLGAEYAFGQPPTALAPLETGTDPTQNAFAPAGVYSTDGAWVVAWTVGPLEARTESDRQDIFVRAFDHALAPRSQPLQVTVQSGSDPRIGRIGMGNDLAVVWGQGTGVQRPVYSVMVRCGAPTWPATP